MAKLEVDGHKHGTAEQPTPPMRLLGSCPRSACNLYQIFGFGSQEYPRSRAGELDDNGTEVSLLDHSEGENQCTASLSSPVPHFPVPSK